MTCCLESCVNWEQPADRLFCSSMWSWHPWVSGRERERERGVAGLRDRPFILKGLFTAVISALGTGYNARYQGIMSHVMSWTHWVALFFFCVWEMFLSENHEDHYLCHYLKKKLATVGFHHCAFFSEQTRLCSSINEWETIPGSVLSFLLVCTMCILVRVGTHSLPSSHQSNNKGQPGL